jgi:hypothetical protein
LAGDHAIAQVILMPVLLWAHKEHQESSPRIDNAADKNAVRAENGCFYLLSCVGLPCIPLVQQYDRTMP